MAFRTKYDRKPINTNPGNGIRTVYGSKLDSKKNIVIEKKGEENLYAYINSFADSVDINVLLARFANGDREALLQRAGAYIDVASMPTNINDFIEYSRSAQALYDTLPAAVKEKFGNNVMQFISSVNDKEWNEIMNTSKAQINKEISDESRDAKKAYEAAIKPITENPGSNIPVEPPVKEDIS